jgi:hypothetical protein
MSPANQAITVNGANLTGVNFMATATTQTYSISGTISGGSGATVTLSGATSKNATANGSGSYSFTGLANGSYTVTPTKSGYLMTPATQTVTINGANVSGVNFTAAHTYSISGTVTGASGTTVNLTGAATATVTISGSGIYTFSGLVNGSYTVTPSQAGFTFSPASKAVTISRTNVTGVNFTATYSISGTISGGSSATVILSGALNGSTTADAGGDYIFSGLANGSYIITPSMTGFIFSPSSLSITINGANVIGANFTASVAPPTYSISGKISPASCGAGAAVSLSGALSLTTTADGTGAYGFSGLSAGSYTVTPSSQIATFTSTSQYVTVGSSNITGVDFAATPSSAVSC